MYLIGKGFGTVSNSTTGGHFKTGDNPKIGIDMFDDYFAKKKIDVPKKGEVPIKGASGADDILDGDWSKYMSPEDARRYNEWHNVRDAGYELPWEDYLSIREKSIKNPNSDSLTLGKYLKNEDGTVSSKAYTEMAKNTGDTYFDLGENWDSIKTQYGLNDDQMFDLFNKPALDDAVKAGKEIRFTQDPMAYGDCALKEEWKYLQDTYKFRRLEERGGYWYAK